MNLPSNRPALMGILNVTPDSFSDGGEHNTTQSAIDWGLKMIEDGADLIDVGGESTRPGADEVTIEEELRRVIPVVETLSHKGIAVSIDTMKPEVAREALDAGAFLVNDVGGLRDDRMMQLCIQRRCVVCIMHMQGVPRTMQSEPVYSDVVNEVSAFLKQKAELLLNSGIPLEGIWIDPGFGFGKTVEHNLELIRRLDEIAALGFPVLVGVSRKSFIGKVLGSEENPLPVEERREGTLAVQAVAQLKGARIIRAHDVKESRRVIDVISRVR
jgi:dihydropteroate synthase